MKIVKKRRSSRSSKYFKPSRRLVASICLVVVLLIALGFTLAHRRNEAAKTKDGTTINLNPSTAAEKTETEQHKEDLAKNGSDSGTSSSTSSSSTQKKTVKPVITDTSNNNIRAYVSGVFEDGGTCTATFTKDGKTLTKTSTGFENVSYTQCAPINYESSFLSAGQWSVTVKYSSSTAEGVSDASLIK